MDSVVWMGMAGLITTLLAPVVAEWMRRDSARRDRIETVRLDAYSNLLRVTARMTDNAMTWASIPLADLGETTTDELDRVIARATVVASRDVRTHMDQINRAAGEFNRRLYEAKIKHRAVHNAGQVDDGTTIAQRLNLGSLADTLRTAHQELETAIRKEVGA